MNLNNYRVRFTVVSILLLVWLGRGLWPTVSVNAQSAYPTAEDIYVNDYADVINSTDEAQIRSLLAAYEADQGVQISVLTVRSLGDFDTGDATIEQFATNLFNEWGIGQASRNDGVLILVAVEDRELRIELGAAYGMEFNGRMQRVIDQIIIPYFRQENYSLGIHEGTRAILAALDGVVYESLAETRGTTAPRGETGFNAPTAVPSSSLPQNLGSILLGLGAVAVPLSGFLFSRYRRYKPRQCSNCQHQLVRLDEKADDQYLDKGQIMEEVLSSVDYDVWRCDNCQHYEVIAYRNWFRRLKSCSSCGYRTASTTSTVVQSATYSSTGLRRHHTTCSHCNHEEVRETVIPMRVRSDDSSSSSSRSSSSRSSSSSFGGGRSSGGGASGKW